MSVLSHSVDSENLNCPMFAVSCDGGDAGLFRARTEKLSVTIAQQIDRNGSAEMWEVLLVRSEVANGISVSHVLLCHPDWDEPMEIARIESGSDKLDVQMGAASHAAL